MMITGRIPEGQALDPFEACPRIVFILMLSVLTAIQTLMILMSQNPRLAKTGSPRGLITR
jgi:uncharacterized membrane protein